MSIPQYNSGALTEEYPKIRLTIMTTAATLPLVSVLIPAYSPRFFERCLASALEQSYPNLEVVVCDDSPKNRIREICMRSSTDRLRYIRNPKNLGFSANFTKCFHSAKGEYIKFLNHDDFLHNGCVELMMTQLSAADSGISMAFSKRAMVDENNQRLPDNAVTARLSENNCRFQGRMLGDRLLFHSANFIGEPTTVLFRKSDLQADPHNIFLMNGNDYHCLADVSLWLRLLSNGDAVYFRDELSAFRFHPGQEQKKPEVAIKCLTERFTLLEDGRKLGFLSDPRIYRGAAVTVLNMINGALTAKQFPQKFTPTLTDIQRTLVKTLN